MFDGARTTGIFPTVKTKKQRISKQLVIGLVLFLIFFRLGLFLADSIPGMKKLELNITDAKHRRFRANFAIKDSPVMIVDIDDSSYESLHAIWPWSRSYYARLIRNLNRAGARYIIIDIVLDKAKTDDPAGDSLFSQALKTYPNVLLSGKLQKGKGLQALVLPDSRFLNADSSNWAMVDVTNDIDNVVREYDYSFSTPYGSARQATLAVRAYQAAAGREWAPPPDRSGFRIAYPGGARSFPYVPFYQVIDDGTLFTRDESQWGEEINWFDTLLQAKVFENKIVFVGASLLELHDEKLTPFSAGSGDEKAKAVPGVEVHAAAFHTLFNDFRISIASPYVTRFVILLLCFALFFLGTRLRLGYVLLLFLFFSLGWVAVSLLAFKAGSLIIPVVPATVCMVLITAGQQGFLVYLEQKQRRNVTGMFGQYVPRAVVKELIRNPDKMRLGGERRKMSVLFSDVAGFTTISEDLEPEALVDLLNEYLSAMTEIIHAHGGIIDKYEGDAIMAEFGIPLVQPDHALRACRSAFGMQNRLNELREKWESEGRPELKTRIGIGTGMMVFGNMGSNQAFDYTVMGDVVNLAARLEGANKAYGTRIMTNDLTYTECREAMLFRELDLLRVKGKNRPVKCYQLMAENSAPQAGDIRKVIDRFAEGLRLYRDRQWDLALTCFNDVLKVWIDDVPSHIYVDRCTAFKKTPPAKDWDGVFTMEKK